MSSHSVLDGEHKYSAVLTEGDRNGFRFGSSLTETTEAPSSVRSADCFLRQQSADLMNVPDRIVVAPRTGVFIPLEQCQSLVPGSMVRSGQPVGYVRCGEETLQVTSPFDGVARNMLALPNERVQQYQPVLWMAASN